MMREISFVRKLKFNFNGSITKRALVIGDVDNDQRNELVCANLQGNLAVFKGTNPERYAYANKLGMVTACIVGDVINCGQNYIAAINTEGLLFIFSVPNVKTTLPSSEPRKPASKWADDTSGLAEASSQVINTPMKPDTSYQNMNISEGQPLVTNIELQKLYEQRMPANCKELLLADLDGDGQNEVIVGLTDRVLRTYKWVKINEDKGKFVGLYKWEFADQIGSVSLNPSRHDNCQDIIVAQPGGTYAKLECFDKKSPNLFSSPASSSVRTQNPSKTVSSPTDRQSPPQPISLTFNESVTADDNVRTEYISKLTPEYHQLALAQMRNPHISTEVLGGIRSGKSASCSSSPSLIAVATLDGTLMTVDKDEILWSIQVDHQLFALSTINVKSSSSPVLSQSESTCTIVSSPSSNTKSKRVQSAKPVEPSCDQDIADFCEASRFLPSGVTTQRPTCDQQYLVVCAWNGKTYIIDEDRNYLRFKFDEAVSAFTAGNYFFDEGNHASLVYATFNNQVVLYYDVILENIRPMYMLNEVLFNPENKDLLNKLDILGDHIGLYQSSDGIESSGAGSVEQVNKSVGLFSKTRDLLQQILSCGETGFG